MAIPLIFGSEESQFVRVPGAELAVSRTGFVQLHGSVV
jgi:hypothetical protein